MAMKDDEAGENQPDSAPNPKSNVNSSKKRKIELEALDCYICCKPFKNKKCPFCNTRFNEVSRRGIENVLKSLKGSCPNSKYGCKQKLRFDQRKEHEAACPFGPCSCPLPDCKFIASSKQLYSHLNCMHPGSPIKFQYFSRFTITLKTDDKFLVLQEKNAGVLFILGNRTEPLGKAISITCIGSAAVEERLSLEMVLKTKEATLSFQSVMRGIKVLVDDSTPEEFLLIPNKFVGSNNRIKVDLRIW